MKKIISMLITASLIAAMAVIPSFTAQAAANEEDGIVALVKELEIIQGDENGDMGLDRKVSRAEFAKIAIALSPSKNTVAVGLAMSPFKDVPYTTWYAPYVRAAVSAGYVEGYLDATYRPDNTVTYEEAITVLLKILGYTDDSFGAAYPYGQVAKAQGLDMLDDVDAEIGQELTRRQVMYLVYNTLQANMTSGGKLLSVHDCTMTEDVTVISSHNEDSSLAENKILTSSGTYKTDNNFNYDFVGQKGDIFVKNGTDFVAFVPDSNNNTSFEKYVIYSQLPNAVVAYNNGSFTQIDITDGTTCYKDGNKTTYAAVKNQLEMGDILYVRKDGNSVDYVTYDDGNMEGPVKVTGSGSLAGFATNSSTVFMRNGNKVSSSDLQTNDIVYYSEDLNMVLAYTDKVTGVYEKASPTKDSPTSVTISGKEYTVESVDAFNDLSSSGSFKYGDTVTVLLGRTGEIAGVVGGSSSSSSVSTSTSSTGSTVGYVIEAGKKDFSNSDGSVYSSYYVKMVTADGTVNEYAASNNCSSLVCSIAKATFKNGKASVTRQSSSSSSLSGKVNASKGIIGSTDIADNIKILDTSGTYSDDTPLYTSIYPQRIDGVTLSSSNVLYYSKNSAGEIDELILKDVTGDTYTYGVITSINKSTGAYNIDISGSQNAYMTGFSSTATGPHKFKMSGGSIQNMQQLASYSSNISELTTTTATINGQSYLLSDKVVVYNRTGAGTYMKITLDDAISGSYKLTAYYDKAQSSGGRIRIIIAQAK